MEVNPATETQNSELSQTKETKPKPDSQGFKLAVIIGILIIFLLILLGLPPIRDWILTWIAEEKRVWLRDNKQFVLGWTEWARVVFEVALGLFISNQIFNELLRDWFVQMTQNLQNILNNIINNSIKKDDARVRIRKALTDIIISISGTRKLYHLPSDLFDLFIAWRQLVYELKSGLWFLFFRLICLKLLNVFSGRLHALAALFSFLGVLLMKTVKLYLDSSILK